MPTANVNVTAAIKNAPHQAQAFRTVQRNPHLCTEDNVIEKNLNRRSRQDRPVTRPAKLFPG
jgi:hypothetical protein